MVTQTAAERREQKRQEYNAYLETCPSRLLMEAISDKWVVLVLSALSGAPTRYSELRRRIAGVSQKMLTQTLRNLERDGLVDRTVEATVPVSVTYGLTETGRSLLQVVEPLKRWAEQHMGDVLAARSAYADRSA